MINWAKECIMDTVGYRGGVGFITSNGHIIGFRIVEVISRARKTFKTHKVEVSFIAMNTVETPKRPDKKTLIIIMEQLGLDQTFIDLTSGKNMQSSFSGGNEIRLFEDHCGKFFKEIEYAAKEIYAEGWSRRHSNLLLNPEAGLECPFSLNEVKDVKKHGHTYTIIGETAKVVVNAPEGETITFRGLLINADKTETDINLSDDYFRNILCKLYVKGSPNYEFFINDAGHVVSLIDHNEVFNAQVVKQLEKAYIKYAGLILSPKQQMNQAIRKAKLESNPFAALKKFPSAI